MRRRCLLGDAINLKRGYDLPHQLRKEGIVPIVSSAGVTGTHADYKVRGPGVVTGRYGTLGEVHYVPNDFWPLNTTLYVEDFKGNDVRYISYLLRTLDFGSRSGAAAVPGVNRNDLHRLPISIPEVGEQRRIASILTAYDDLIENNTRRIAILEEIALRTYEEWFVHFRFPGHEQVTLVESELGSVPDTWSVGRLDDVLVLQRGFDLPRQDRTAGDFPIISATGQSGTHIEPRVKAPGVVTGRSGSLGAVMYIDTDFWPLNTTLWVKEFKLGSPLHALFVLRSIDLAGFNSGAAVPTLNRNDIHGLPTLLPEGKVLGLFEKAVSPLFRLKHVLERKNSLLRETRDLLLPKLIMGELDVANLTEPEEAIPA